MKKTFKKYKKKKDKFKKKTNKIKTLKKLQHIIYEKDSKDTRESIKHIYIKNKAGFGNKVFDLIFAIYLYNLYNKKDNNCIIHYVLKKSSHDKYNDPKLYTIFPNSKTKINFITEKQYKSINNKYKPLLLDLGNIVFNSGSRGLSCCDLTNT